MQILTQTIKELFSKNTQIENDLAVESLETISDQNFSAEDFFHELLQNADDAYINSSQKTFPVSVTFTENYLVIRHNGKRFDAGDLVTLCKLGDKLNVKRENRKMTGHKGVGFKSIFTITNEVIIVSEDDIFAFDKQHPTWCDKTNLYPWNVIPILKSAQDIPEEIRLYMPNSSVTFALKIDALKKETVIETVTGFFKKSANIAFFHRIDQIQFELLGKNPERYTLSRTLVNRMRVSDTFKARQWQITNAHNDSTVKQTWAIFTVKSDIPDEVRTSIMQLKCVTEKHKKAKDLKFSYAVQVEGHTFLKTEDSTMYLTLPTEIKNEFNFLINAEFLLDLTRNNLHKDAKIWNRFILTTLYLNQLVVLQHLAKTEFWKNTPNFLSDPGQSKHLKKLAFTSIALEIFTRHLNNSSIVRSLDPEQTLTVPQCKIDPFNFVLHYGTATDKKEYSHPEYGASQLLFKSFGAEQNSIDYFIKEIKWLSNQPTLHNSKANGKFIEYLHNILSTLAENEKNCVLKEISDTPLFFSSRKKLCSLRELRVKSSKLDIKELNDLFDFPYPNFSEKIHTALQELGIQELDLNSAIELINQRKSEDLISFANILTTHGSLKEDDFPSLTQLNFVNRKGESKSLHQLYLGSAYDPDFDLEVCFPDYPDFISKDYKANEASDIFFITLSAQDELTNNNLQSIIAAVNTSPNSLIPFTRALFDFMHEDESDDDQIQAIKNHCKKLNCKTDTNTTVAMNECYLPKDYNPKKPLEEYHLDIPFLNTAYITNPDEVDEWRDFFVSAGVLDSLHIVCIPSREYAKPLDATCAKYFSDLIYNAPKEGLPICPPWKMRFKHSHIIRNLYHIPFLSKIITSNLFWEIISADWALVKKENSMYVAGDSVRTITNSMKYYINLACFERYQKHPNELYAPNVKKELGALATQSIVCMEEVALLSETQIKDIGFNTKLTLDDCYKLLLKAQECEITSALITALCFIYQCLITHKLNNEVIPSNLKLLRNDNHFYSPTEVFLLTSSELQEKFTWNHQLRTPKMRDDELIKLAHRLKVQRINPKELTPVFNNKKEDIQLKNRLIEVAIIIALLEVKQPVTDYSAKELLAPVKTWLVNFISLLNAFTCYNVSSLALRYREGVENEILTWLAKNELLVIVSKSRQVMHQKMKALCQYFKLSIDPTLLADVLESNVNSLQSSYRILNIDTINMIASACADLIPTVNNDVATTSEIPRQFNTHFSEESYLEVGWPAEHFVFLYIANQLKEKANHPQRAAKYANATYTEELTAGIAKLEYGDHTKRLQWLNPKRKVDEDSKEPYDLVQTTYIKGKITKKILIEVKGSNASTEHFQAYLSKPQLAQMPNLREANDAFKQGYRLYCVFKPTNPQLRTFTKSHDPLHDERLKKVVLLFNR